MRIGELATRTKSHWALLLSMLIKKGETNLCYDGKPFFATNHKEEKSGEQSNKITFDLAKAAINGEVGTVDGPTEAALREAILLNSSIISLAVFSKSSGSKITKANP